MTSAACCVVRQRRIRRGEKMVRLGDSCLVHTWMIHTMQMLLYVWYTRNPHIHPHIYQIVFDKCSDTLAVLLICSYLAG
jgi:hypothetical protein